MFYTFNASFNIFFNIDLLTELIYNVYKFCQNSNFYLMFFLIVNFI